ncbi:MAG: lytic transglycosylase domain-containing protein, partial [Solirubrobacteraceae bacterium]
MREGAVVGARSPTPTPLAPIAAAAGLLSAAVLLALSLLAGVLGGSFAGAMPAGGGGAAPSAYARSDIPPEYLRLYERAAARWGLDWAILAGIGRVECDHGRDPDPSCHREGAVNSAGAGGPMQFLGSTWAAYGVDANGDGRADRWEPADAIFAAASYLHAS